MVLEYVLGIITEGLATFHDIYNLYALNYSLSLLVSEIFLDVSFIKTWDNFHQVSEKSII